MTTSEAPGWVDATLDLLASNGVAGDDAKTALASFGRRLNDASFDDLALAYGPDGVRVVSIIRNALTEAPTHWLTFDEDRRIIGCHCGFVADESDEGWGDSVVTHLLAVNVANAWGAL